MTDTGKEMKMAKSISALTGLFFLCTSLASAQVASNHVTDTTQNRLDTMRVYLMPEIVVTATRELRSINLSPASVSLVDSSTINMRNVYAVASMIQTVPNLVLEGTLMGAFQAPSIRGFSAADNLVLWDGVPMNTGFANWGNIVSIPLSNLRKIEVIRGSNAIHYGPNALGGVINILSGGEDRSRLRLGVRRGSFGFERYEGMFRGEYRELCYSLSASKDLKKGYLKNTDFDGLNLFSKMCLNNFKTSFAYTDAAMGIPVNPSSPQRFDYWRNGRGSISYQGEFLTRFYLSFLAYANIENSRLLVYTDTSFTKVKDNFKNHSLTQGGELILNSSVKSVYFSLGLQAKSDVVDMAYIGGKHSTTIYGAFLNGQKNLSQFLTLHLGLRRDRRSLSGEAWNYNMGLIGQWNHQLRLRLLYGTTSRFPALRELFLQSPSPGRGNENLASERGRTLEGGIDLTFFRGLKAIFSAFYTEADNLIDRDLSVKPWVFENIRSARMKGLEGEISLESKGVDGFLNLSTLNALDLSTQEPLNFRPRYQIAVGVRTDFFGFSLSFTGRRLGKQRYIEYTYGGSGVKHIPSYSLLDAKITYTHRLLGELFLAFDNLFDTDYLLEGHQQATPVLPGQPRSFTLGYSIKW